MFSTYKLFSLFLICLALTNYLVHFLCLALTNYLVYFLYVKHLQII